MLNEIPELEEYVEGYKLIEDDTKDIFKEMEIERNKYNRFDIMDLD